jgi:hypothetical protein
MKPCYVTIDIQEPNAPTKYLRLSARVDAHQRITYLPEWVAERWGVPLCWLGSVREGDLPEPLFPLANARVRCLDRESMVHAVFHGDECVLGTDALTALDLLILPSEGLVIGNPRQRATHR